MRIVFVTACVRLLCAMAITARADTITVINTDDSGLGSLRQALVEANDGDTIDFDPALKGQTIILTTAELVISKSITIAGPGADLLAVSRAENAPAFRIFHVFAKLQVLIQGLTVSNNSTDGTGGGICVENNATMTIERSTLNGNYAGDYGGGMANDGTIMINDCTLSDNRGEFAAGVLLNGFTEGASLTVNNSTLSGNTTQLHGGGIANIGGQAVITNSTLSGNSGTTAGAINNRLAILEIKNTALNRGDFGPNILNDSGTVISHGHNISSDNADGLLTGPGDQINTDPMLAPLQDNGGPTLPQALLPDSPAIDAGDPNFIPPPFFDQRGTPFVRVFNGRIDIGSF